MCKTKRKPDEFEIRIIKTMEEGNQPNLHLSFFKVITPSLQNFNEEETLQFQMAVLQLLANIKHRKPSNFSSRPLPMHNQPFHTSSHVGRYNPLLVYASTMNPHHSNITAVQPLAVDTAHCGTSTGNTQHTSVTSDTKPKCPVFSSTDRAVTVHTLSP